MKRRRRRLDNLRLLIAITGASLVALVVLATIYQLTPPCEQGVGSGSHVGLWLSSSSSSSSSQRRNSKHGSSSSNSSSSNYDADPCVAEYNRVTMGRVPGLTPEDLERSVAHVGNRQRLAKLGMKLSSAPTGRHSNSNSNQQQQQQAVVVAVCGGSISLGHGVEPRVARYSDQLEVWLNDMYPLPPTPATTSNQQQQQQQHRVYNRGSHGADVRLLWHRFSRPADTTILRLIPPSLAAIKPFSFVSKSKPLFRELPTLYLSLYLSTRFIYAFRCAPWPSE